DPVDRFVAIQETMGLCVEDEHRIRNAIEERSVLSLTFAERSLRAFALSDIAAVDDNCRSPRFVRNGAAHRLEYAPGSVLVTYSEFDCDVSVRSVDRPIERVLHLGQVLGMHELE